MGDIDHLRRIFPTGKSFSEPTAHVWDIEGGKIVRFRQYVETVSLWGQIEA